ncbi:E3 ubiquitin-protein ligase TRIM56 [Holothuria leucospilota]|uniref:E3 ubiquitin-protein ligase TRIM56 n=1 Tax=Holothuria leucospilota TaxID=206669 RepID=A0A9Q1C2Y4_HOLLE|nr:E3 ubiquitin-protein ligase TRIM56 [Holothuria leucospilota]
MYTMASGNTLEDIGDKFCQCSVCLEYFKEPKLLPCLHRFCKECLHTLIQNSQEILKCPECREEFEIPITGVEGFSTDFNTKSLVEYVHSQQTHESDEIRKCHGCSKLLKVAGYCLKCNGFLCFECYTVHKTKDTLEPHRHYTLSVEDMKSKSATKENLPSARDAPRCHIHSETISNLCCKKCNNRPVCTSCLYGHHRDHDVCEIKTLAKSERDRLKSQVEILENVKQSKFAVSPGDVTEKLFLNATSAKEIYQKEYDDEAQKLKSTINNINKIKVKIQFDKESEKQKAFSSLDIEMDREIEEIRSKYEKLKKEREKTIDNGYQDEEDKLKDNLHHLHTKLETLNKVKVDKEELIETQMKERLKILIEIRERFDSTHKHLKDLEAKVSDIVFSDNDWMAIERTSGVCSECDLLIEDVKGFPDYASMSDIEMDRRQITAKRNVTITISEKESTITISVMKGLWIMKDISANEDGNIVIAGQHVQKTQSIILVVDRNGTLIQQHILRNNSVRERFCCCLAHGKVASVCQPDEIGIFHIRENSYTKKNMHEISDWPSNRLVSCVAASGMTNSIFVGNRSSRAVYVFDDNLNHRKTITLPDIIKGSYNLSVYETKRIVCDFDRKKVVVTDIDGSEIRNFCELKKPDVDRAHLRPRNVCTDKNGYIYVLWTSENFFGRDRCILAQYSEDGRQLLEARQLTTGLRCLSVMKTDKGEKLVVAAWDTFHLYGLLELQSHCRNERIVSQYD